MLSVFEVGTGDGVGEGVGVEPPPPGLDEGGVKVGEPLLPPLQAAKAEKAMSMSSEDLR